MKYASLLICSLLFVFHSAQSMDKLQLCFEAIEKNSLPDVKTLVETDIPIHIPSDFPPKYTGEYKKSLLEVACSLERIEIIDYFLTHKETDEISKYLKKSLFSACDVYNKKKTVRAILAKKPEAACMQNNAGDTPLHRAVVYANTECIHALLETTSKTINIQNYYGEIPLHCLWDHNKDRLHNIIELLIKKGSCLTTQNNMQFTPLAIVYCIYGCFPSFNGNPIFTKEMIQGTDTSGNTQLHFATKITNTKYKSELDGSMQKINICLDNYLLCLIEQGIHIHAKNKMGETATNIACAHYNKCYKDYEELRICSRKQILTQQERVMHSFLRVTSPYIECVLLKSVLEQPIHGTLLPHELKQLIMHMYYKVNVETIVAKKHKNNQKYYDDFIENKEKIKKQLRDKPENPHLLWR